MEERAKSTDRRVPQHRVPSVPVKTIDPRVARVAIDEWLGRTALETVQSIEVTNHYSKQEKMMMRCCLCNKAILKQPNGWSKGHNAEPVTTGRCCADCAFDVVLPARMRQFGQNQTQTGDNSNDKN